MKLDLRRRLADAAHGYAERNGVGGVDEYGERAAQLRLETMHEQFPARHERIGRHLGSLLGQAGVTGGRVLEIGGRSEPYRDLFPGWQYDNLDLAEDVESVTVVGDITHCPQLESGSYDAIISVDALEAVTRPWLAAAEIVRLLRPGGFTYHSTVFSWRYHPCPVDYWRFSPDALTFLFADLTLMRADFDTVERRRNLIGKGRNRVEVDAFGGWRENWRVFYAGVKPEA